MEIFENKRRIFGRRIGRPLNASRKNALEKLPLFAIPETFLTERADLNPEKLFPKKFDQYWMEIGFGNGEHLSALLTAHPDKAFIGAEPFINGMAAFLKSIEEQKPDNIRILMDDAMKIMHSLKDASLNRLYILNPDPWPKKRHHKRRIVNQENLNAFARVLEPGALLIMATDVDDLAEWMVTETSIHPGFEWLAEKSSDWLEPPPDWAVTTRYAQKGLDSGRRETYLLFRRIP